MAKNHRKETRFHFKSFNQLRAKISQTADIGEKRVTALFFRGSIKNEILFLKVNLKFTNVKTDYSKNERH